MQRHQVYCWCSASLLIALLVGILEAWILVRRRRKSRLPPGPRGLPIIGHLHLLGELPHRSIYELSKVHGPLMLLRLGSVPILVASSPDMARQILKDHELAFADRPSSAVGRHIFGGPKSSLLYSSAIDPQWKLLRRISASELFTSKQLDRFAPLRIAEARGLMRSIFDDCVAVGTAPAEPTSATSLSRKCCLRPKVLQALSDLVTKMMTGQTLTELAGEEAARIVQLIVEVPELLGKFNVGDYLPFLAWMDLQGYERRSKEVAAALREAFDRICETRRSHVGAAKRDAYFLDVLMECARSSSSTSTTTSVMENFLEFFIGGTDTCAATIEWALAELVKNPEKLHLVQTEIEKVVGRERIVEEEDIAHLPYLVACVKETMRLHPVGPFIMPHKTNQRCEISNYEIPANTQVLVNLWAIGRDSHIWEHPLQFLPERFMKIDPIDMQGHHFELIPFGAGRRICPGLRLALLSTNLILACLLQGFDWTLTPSQCLDMTEQYGSITSMKNPLVALVKPRLSKELYTLV